MLAGTFVHFSTTFTMSLWSCTVAKHKQANEPQGSRQRCKYWWTIANNEVAFIKQTSYRLITFWQSMLFGIMHTLHLALFLTNLLARKLSFSFFFYFLLIAFCAPSQWAIFTNNSPNQLMLTTSTAGLLLFVTNQLVSLWKFKETCPLNNKINITANFNC